MPFSLFKIFTIFGLVSTWASKALADGRVTLAEAVELVTGLCGILGVVPELDVPNTLQPEIDQPESTSEAEGAPQGAPEERPPPYPPEKTNTST